MSEMTVIFALAAFFLQLKAIEHRGDPIAPALSIIAWVAASVTIALLLLT